jgi:hypothetical protein
MVASPFAAMMASGGALEQARLTAATANATAHAMHRAIPKIVVLAAIAAVVLGIYWKTQSGPPREPGVIYINPNIDGNP